MLKKTLAELKKGQTAIVNEINCENTIANRLMDMGLVKDAPIRHLGVAPLGDPLLIEVRGIFLAIAKSIAKCITLKVI